MGYMDSGDRMGDMAQWMFKGLLFIVLVIVCLIIKLMI